MGTRSTATAPIDRVWTPILAAGLDLVFVGFNPSLPAWRTGHYYANPSNRFYHLLAESGLTPRRLTPDEDRTLPIFGIGLVDLLPFPSARANQLPLADFRAAAPALLERLAALGPRAICANGVGVHRFLCGRPPERLGRQAANLVLGSAQFVVPSTSGLCNGRAAERLAAFRELAAWLRAKEPTGERPAALVPLPR